ncbi:MAG TPA: cytochrome P450 [Acidimicrobiales bacterium]|nr:cytochrome P450 [Acidimicrobiales bacterium]
MTSTAPAPTTGDEIRVATWAGVRDALRHRELRQALYDEGGVVMDDCLLTLHGPDHRDRRRLENRLFRREVFAEWELEVLGATLDESLLPVVHAGRGDLLTIGYRTTMNLTARVAGVDRARGTVEETEALYEAVKLFSAGATLVHSTRDHDEVRAEVLDALDLFDRELLSPSIERRRALIARAERGEIGDDDLPRDVLTTLLRNQDRLDLPHDVLRREIAFYLQAGSHSTANAFTHTVDELFRWGADHPDDLDRAAGDLAFVQRCVHETLRLHPASPVAWRRAVADTTLRDGTPLPAGALVVVDILAANTEPATWGQGGTAWDPHREPPDGVAAWGHSFGGGMHVCIGRELDGGHELDPGACPRGEGHLYGTVARMVAALLAHGGRPDPADPAVLDPTSTRRHFSRYPVVFTGTGTGA